MTDKLALPICWNCKNYDSFGGICLYYGITKQVNETCTKFNVDQYKEMITHFQKRIAKLESEIEILKERINNENKIIN